MLHQFHVCVDGVKPSTSWGHDYLKGEEYYKWNLMLLAGMHECVAQTSTKWVMWHAVDFIMLEVMSQMSLILQRLIASCSIVIGKLAVFEDTSFV